MNSNSTVLLEEASSRAETDTPNGLMYKLSLVSTMFGLCDHISINPCLLLVSEVQLLSTL